MTDTSLTSLSGAGTDSFSSSNLISDTMSGAAKQSDVIANVIVDVHSSNLDEIQPLTTVSLSSASAGQNCPPPDSKSSGEQNHSTPGDKSTKTAVKTSANGSSGGSGRLSSRNHSRHSSSSRSSGKKHSRYSDHRHKSSKSSPLPSESRSRKSENQISQSVSDSNHKSSPGKHKVVSSSAEKRTRIVLHIYEEVLQDGVVVDSKLKQTEFTTSGGSVPWPPVTLDTGISGKSPPASQMSLSNVLDIQSNCDAKLPAVTEKSKHPGRPPKQESAIKRSSHNKSGSDNPASKRVKNEGKSQQSVDNNDEDHRIEMASTLLSLQTESPVKRQENFNEVTFMPLKQGSSCLAKWTDKNYYAGTLSSNLGDGRWHVLFDDGGKKAVNESDIISAPHLAIGQVVMASFSDGSLCVKGMIKQPFYEKNRLFYHVEYNDGNRNFTEKFCRRDIFLTAELAAALLNKQSKKSELSARFADVDLNNIIPKRSRLSAQPSKAPDGSTDDSEPESVSSSVKSLPKTSRKQFTPTKTLAITNSSNNTSNNNAAAVSRHLAKSPIPESETKPDPPHSDGHASSQDEPANTAQQNNDTPQSVEQPDHKAIAAPESKQDLLGPLPEEGSHLFKGINFLLTTADAGNANDATESGRSSAAVFDIPHLIKQIESGGGVVHQTLETAQDPATGGSHKIILLAYTYLRTVKYMQCLAAGIPCLKHTWLVDSCCKNEQQDIDSYRLPSGYSIISNSLITDRSVFASSSTLFNGVRFMLVSKNPRHAESWTSVLTAAKAVVVDDFPSSSGTATRKASNSVDVIISDMTCPPIVIKKAQQMKIPIVSSEYVVQCLINGRRLSCEAHEKFGISHK